MNERPDIEQIKARLVAEILQAIGEWKLTDAAASERLGIAEAKVVRIRSFELSAFSIDELVGFLNDLDQHVEVKVGPVTRNASRAFMEKVAAIRAQVPPEEWEKLPRDLAQNIDHYLYGAPKQD